MEHKLDKDYLSYLKEEGKSQEAIWLYLDYITEMLEHICDSMPMTEEMKDKNMMGMFKIQPSGKSGLHKGPPSSVIS